MDQRRTQDLLNRRATDLQNEQLAERMRFARASRAALPLIEEGQRLFHRNRIQSDDDRFRNLYDPYNSSGDTDQGVAQQPVARAPGVPKFGFGFADRLGKETSGLF
jgi:hypothetical protein